MKGAWGAPVSPYQAMQAAWKGMVAMQKGMAAMQMQKGMAAMQQLPPAKWTAPSSASKHAEAPILDQHVSVVWVTLDPAHSPLLGEAGAQDSVGACAEYEKGKTAFTEGAWYLGELVGDVKEDFVFHHDADGTEYPEVWEAVKAVLTKSEETCYGVAFSKSTGKWAIGMGNGWKHRESAGKVALALTIAKDEPEKLARLCKTYPEFLALCQSAGIVAGGAKRKPSGKAGRVTAPVPIEPVVDASELADQVLEPVETGSSELAAHWITVEMEGLPADAPVLVHNKAETAFSEAHPVLSEFVGDITSGCEFTDDPEGKAFPEIMEAISAAGLEENGICVGVCGEKTRWAVGVASGWKDRLRAVKLALAVAIGRDDAAELSRVTESGNYPGFASVCGLGPAAPLKPPKRAGGGGGEPPAKRQARLPAPKASPEPFQQPQRGASAGGKANGKGKTKTRKESANPLPMEVPMWIQLPLDRALPEILGELSGGAVVVGTEGKERRNLYGCIDKVLGQLVKNPKAAIQYHDDPDWSQFAEVGEALKQHGDEQAPLMLAICPEASAWGVGIGYSWHNRHQGAKAALAASIVLRKAEDGDIPELSDLPEFEEFVGEVAVSS